jgi:hypothetical protein
MAFLIGALPALLGPEIALLFSEMFAIIGLETLIGTTATTLLEGAASGVIVEKFTEMIEKEISQNSPEEDTDVFKDSCKKKSNLLESPTSNNYNPKDISRLLIEQVSKMSIDGQLDIKDIIKSDTDAELLLMLQKFYKTKNVEAQLKDIENLMPVSYTHLTLPTM